MDMDYEENIVAEGTEEFVVDADKQAKFMESSKERMNKICIQLAYLEKSQRSVPWITHRITLKRCLLIWKKDLLPVKSIYGKI